MTQLRKVTTGVSDQYLPTGNNTDLVANATLLQVEVSEDVLAACQALQVSKNISFSHALNDLARRGLSQNDVPTGGVNK